MHSAAWVKLLRHIPASEQPNLMLVTSGGIEIAIQCFLRVDPECLAVKGRLAGSQDAGRVFFIPYSHIDYLGFQQALKESEFHDLFGNLDMGQVITPPAVPAAAPDPVAPSASLPEPESAAPTPKPALTPRNPLAIKSSVLEKFRSRSTTNPGTQLRPPLDE
jgi:hypothetical protein